MNRPVGRVRLAQRGAGRRAAGAGRPEPV